MLSISYRGTSVMPVTDYIFTNLMSHNSIGHIYFLLHRRKYQCVTYSGQKSSDSGTEKNKYVFDDRKRRVKLRVE